MTPCHPRDLFHAQRYHHGRVNEHPKTPTTPCSTIQPRVQCRLSEETRTRRHQDVGSRGDEVRILQSTLDRYPTCTAHPTSSIPKGKREAWTRKCYNSNRHDRNSLRGSLPPLRSPLVVHFSSDETCSETRPTDALFDVSTDSMESSSASRPREGGSKPHHLIPTFDAQAQA